MNTNDLKWLIAFAESAGITPYQLQRLAKNKGIKSNDELLLFTETLCYRKRASEAK